MVLMLFNRGPAKITNFSIYKMDVGIYLNKYLYDKLFLKLLDGFAK